MMIYRPLFTPTTKIHLNPALVKTRQGFNLIELMTVMSVLLITMVIGLPGLNQWLQSQKETTVLRSINLLTTLARTRAIKDDQYFTLCASDDQIHCTGSWNKTLIVFNDINKNETVDNEEQLWRVLTLPASTPCLQWNASLGRQYLQFKPSGASNGTAGHFRFCDSVNTVVTKKLVVSLNGRTSLKKL